MLDDQFRMCGAKRRFRDELAARLAIAFAQHKHRRNSRTPERTYRCPHCRGWHLTSQDVGR